MSERLLLKILLVGVLVAGAMALLRDGRLLARAGLVGSCRPVAAASSPQGAVQSCSRGRLSGYPDLHGQSCTSEGVAADGREYWQCIAPIVSSFSPNR